MYTLFKVCGTYDRIVIKDDKEVSRDEVRFEKDVSAPSMGAAQRMTTAHLEACNTPEVLFVPKNPDQWEFRSAVFLGDVSNGFTALVNGESVAFIPAGRIDTRI